MSTADTILARVRLRASQAQDIELPLRAPQTTPAFQADAYQNNAYLTGGADVLRTLRLLTDARPA